MTVRALFANAAFSNPVISEDGATLALVGSKGDLQLILTRPIAGGKLTAIAKLDEPQKRVSWLAWANPKRLFLSVQTRNPNFMGMRSRATYLFGVDADGKNFLWLGRHWPTYGQDEVPVAFQDQIVHWTPDDPETVLVQLRAPYRDYGVSVMKMNVDSGALGSALPGKKDVDDWYADPEGNVRAGIARTIGGEELWTRIEPKGEYELTLKDSADNPEFEFLGFHASDHTTIYVMKNLDGRAAVYEFDLREKKPGKLVFSHPEFDAEGLMRGADGATVVGVRYTTDSPQIHFLDPDSEREHAALVKALQGEYGQALQLVPTSRSRDGNRQVLMVSADTLPPTYFLYDRSKKNMARLIDGQAGIAREQLSPTRRVTYAARDGLSIPAYLTLPRGREPKKLPLVVLLHGGPWARDYIQWDPEVQLFASRGFAVLQVNFRGSTGLGAAFREAGYREWGQKIQDDISDGVKWAVAEGLADPDRIGVYGASFGGYAALVGLAKTPELYRAGAAYAAVTDIELMLSDDKWYDWGAEWHERMVGGGSGDKERLRASSPLRHAGDVRVPVLLGHGTDDQRVHVRESQRMAKALKDAGKDVSYLEFPDEVHGFLLEANRVRWYEALIAFFEKNLAPRERPAAAAPATD